MHGSRAPTPPTREREQNTGTNANSKPQLFSASLKNVPSCAQSRRTMASRSFAPMVIGAVLPAHQYDNAFPTSNKVQATHRTVG